VEYGKSFHQLQQEKKNNGLGVAVKMRIKTVRAVTWPSRMGIGGI
jgi:hypothetical protein